MGPQLENGVAAYEAAYRYIAKIRNPAKKEYAHAYLGYCQGQRTEPERGSLSFMGAQAVRIALAELGVRP